MSTTATPAEVSALNSEQLSQIIPDIKTLLKSGVQFGHETRRWDPRMTKYIFGSKNNIHILDIIKTEEGLSKAVQLLAKLAAKGEILFVGTKRQASDLVRKYAIESGSHYFASRWVGGFFTNFTQVKNSVRRLKELETAFESGVEGRTKYEVSKMKTEWERLNRLYEGVKSIEKWPVAVIVIDPKFEKVAVKESRAVNLPIVALTDSNCNPDVIDYVIPGNDDAIGSIEIVLSTLAKAIKSGNNGNGVKHDLKDYAKVEVKIVRKVEDTTVEEAQPVSVETATAPKAAPKAEVVAEKPAKKAPKAKSKDAIEGGLLGRARQEKSK
jgi:small subunit ribosomal protein S2